MADIKLVTSISGRLSFPKLSMKEAEVFNATSTFPVDQDKIAPSLQLLIEQPMLDRLTKHLVEVFIPECVRRHGDKETRNELSPAEAQRLTNLIESGDWELQPPYIPIKAVSEKNQLSAPEAVAAISIKGNRGQDMVVKARVADESELAAPDPEQLQYPCIKPIGLTIHDVYAGANVAMTLSFYSYRSGKVPGITATAGTLVFLSDNDRFGGGGVDVDLDDDIFLS